MLPRRFGPTLRNEPPSRLAGLAVAAASVAAITALIFPLKTVAPAVSNGVLYLLAVLLVSSIWGFGLGLVTALASALAFNYFHIPPTGRFTISDEGNWVALGVFLVAAAVAGSLAEAARMRAADAERGRREADLAAELARLLLGGTDTAAALPVAGERLARALDLPWAEIELGHVDGDDRKEAFALAEIGTLLVPAALSDDVRTRLTKRVVPALEALLAAALERDALQSEVVETRALRRSDEVKTALLRSVSHDLRSPITAILATGEALGSASLSPDERRELSAAVQAGGERLASLVDKLLDLSRLQAGTAEPHLDWVAIDEVIRDAVQTSGQPERFELALDPGLPLVRADAAQLERALANLLENAARYSGTAPVSVRARAVGPRLMVRVVDRGPGIPRQELERIFEPFYRASDGDRHAGSGLGLAIVRGFVEANGGRVWAESLPGQGTSFVIALPLEEQPTAVEARAG
jgi:two-component system, OmpR family, sensor histidine kinase KdpD